MAKITIADDGRTPLDQVSDRALLLLGVGFGEEVGRVDEFRLMKIPFSTQFKLNNEGIRSFSYRYFKYTQGPISKSIYEDRDALLTAGLLEGGTGSRRLTNLGKRLVRVVLRELPKEDPNSRVIRVLRDQARWIAQAQSWEAIKEKVYAMKVRVVGEDEPMPVADVARCGDLEMQPEGDEKEFALPERLVLTVGLALSMTPDHIRAAETDSGLTLDQVFAT